MIYFMHFVVPSLEALVLLVGFLQTRITSSFFIGYVKALFGTLKIIRKKSREENTK